MGRERGASERHYFQPVTRRREREIADEGDEYERLQENRQQLTHDLRRIKDQLLAAQALSSERQATPVKGEPN